MNTNFKGAKKKKLSYQEKLYFNTIFGGGGTVVNEKNSMVNKIVEFLRKERV